MWIPMANCERVELFERHPMPSVRTVLYSAIFFSLAFIGPGVSHYRTSV